MPLHITHRPNSLDELFGNDSVKVSIQTIFARKDRPSVFLFTGPSGCGKTTMARIVADTLGCHEEDYQELNVSNARGINDARKILDNMIYMPGKGDIRVFVLDEVQQATPDFQQSLLKALEDTPRHVIFILCTTDPKRLLDTIRNRCSTFEMSRLSGPVMRKFLASIIKKEGIQNFPQKAIDTLVEAASGSPRKALVILDTVIDIADDEKLINAIQTTSVSESTVRELCQALLKKQPWKQISTILKGLEEAEKNPEDVRYKVIDYASKVLLDNNDAQAATIIECLKTPLSTTGKAGLVLACWRAVL